MKPLPLILEFFDDVAFGQIEVDFRGCEPVVTEHFLNGRRGNPFLQRGAVGLVAAIRME